MKPRAMSRRGVIIAAAGASLGTLVPRAGAQQSIQVPSFSIDPSGIGEHHRRAMEALQKVLGQRSINSPDGRNRVTDWLVELKLITKEEAELLKRLIDSISKRLPINDLSKSIDALYQEATKKSWQVAIAITSIAKDSVAYARTLGEKEKIDTTRVVVIVSADVMGALAGVGALAQFGPLVALAGALGGAVAGSAIQAYGQRLA